MRNNIEPAPLKIVQTMNIIRTIIKIAFKTSFIVSCNYYLIHFSSNAPTYRPHNTNRGSPPDAIIAIKMPAPIRPEIIGNTDDSSIVFLVF